MNIFFDECNKKGRTVKFIGKFQNTLIKEMIEKYEIPKCQHYGSTYIFIMKLEFYFRNRDGVSHKLISNVML